MNSSFVLLGYPVPFDRAMIGALAGVLILLLVVLTALLRSRGVSAGLAATAMAREQELAARIDALARSSAEITGRLGSLGELLGSRQTDLARLMADRLDHVGQRLGVGLEAHAQMTGDNLSRLNERLAVIDAAQARLAGMTEEVVTLKDILSNKQSRGAFGQGRMEAIVRDGLPAGAYEFQATLKSRARPDCLLRLPGDPRGLCVDAKFPLEAFTAFRDARDEDTRKAAMARVRADVGKHVKDIAERYLVPGETQDIALMFVPSESVYSDLVESFDDVVQKAHRGRVVIVSPSLMMMAIQLMQTLSRDARLRDSANLVHAEVGKLLKDVRLIGERAARLEQHFRQAQEDVTGITTSADKIARRAERIDQMEFDETAAEEPLPQLKLARGAE